MGDFHKDVFRLTKDLLACKVQYKGCDMAVFYGDDCRMLANIFIASYLSLFDNAKEIESIRLYTSAEDAKRASFHCEKCLAMFEEECVCDEFYEED